jgi:hypothetical protein
VLPQFQLSYIALIFLATKNGMASVIFMTDTADQQFDHRRFDTNDGYSKICVFLHYFPVNNFPEFAGHDLQDILFPENDGIISCHVEAGWLRIKCLTQECERILGVIGQMRLFVCHEEAEYNMHIYAPEAVPRIQMALDTDQEITNFDSAVETLDNENWFINAKDIRFIESVRAQARWRNHFTVGPRNAHAMISEEYLSFRRQKERVFLVINPFDEAN